MKKYCFTFVIALTFAVSYSQETKKDYTDAFKLIETWLEAQKDYENIPGMSAIVVEDNRVLWSGAFGKSNIEDNIDAKPSTLYSICSISKLFTSVAIMKLYDDGKLRLDDKISDLIPWYNLKQKFPDSGPITVRTLLTHSSGLPREADIPYWTGPNYNFPDKDQIKKVLGGQETVYSASKYFHYSNLGMTLLGEIIEKVSGVSYKEYINKNILKPLGLKNTRPYMPKSLHGKELAIGYSSTNRNRDREAVKFFQANAIKPAAGFTSNVEDLGKFASWQFRLADTTISEILKPSTLEYMQNIHWTDPDFSITQGLGFIVYKGQDGCKWVGHGGNCPGYQTTLIMNPKYKRAYSVMINANSSNPEKYAKEIHNILCKMDRCKNKNLKENNKKIDLKDYVGLYDAKPGMSEICVSEWAGYLAIMFLPADSPSKSMIIYKHTEKDTFQRLRDNSDMGEKLIFEKDKKGKVIHFIWDSNYFKKMKLTK